MGLIYSEKSQGKEDKEGQKEWPDYLEEGSEVELTGELIWQLGSDAVKLHLVCNTMISSMKKISTTQKTVISHTMSSLKREFRECF